jgi:hypothetical protein
MARQAQPFFSKYKIAQNTSYKSTSRGLVLCLALSSMLLIASNWALLMSLGYTFLAIIAAPPDPLMKRLIKRH